ncbi:hypothetical protein K469DRAFT_745524 [Zopfia rhizophila CBS 207.26]|uniref:Uncharacterized protein n=1 Tax=Zopfia rhizophila CBS 207.26 TaxID=1314779 RepID=A0A6A6EQC8_9PEZI|nr:hypothetical protein K469DRAFT_745524 [Zopfia rhizophila CBS 207.26]
MSDPSTHLVLVSGRNALPQTGVWNMLDLAKIPVQTTLGVLSRYSAARVDPYTALVGEVMCERFQLTKEGRKRVRTAVGSLKTVGSIGNILQFGFGIEDVVRKMAQAERGCVCLALCAALKECYTDYIAVEILLEMVRLLKADGQYMPSSQSREDLLYVCAGTLSASKFPYLAEHLMRLQENEHRLGAFQGLRPTPKSVRGCSKPKAIAESLLALARISSGDIHAITIYGGSDTGWLAAIAEWLLDLKISIRSSDGRLLYSNGEAESIQLNVITKAPPGQITPEVLRTETTLVLDDIYKLFEKEGRSLDAAIVSGRLDWKDLLSSAFLSDFKNLMKIARVLGECIGSAARLFKGLALADETFPFSYRESHIDYSDKTYGPGFVKNVVQWFPELCKLKDIMDQSVLQDLVSARRSYEITGHNIFEEFDEEDVEMTPAPEYEDSQCSSAENYDGAFSERKEQSADGLALNWNPDRFCQVVITETIISLSRTMSHVCLEDENLLPTRSGIESAYGRQMSRRLSARHGKEALRTVGPIAFCLESGIAFPSQVEEEENKDGVELRLYHVLELFAGRTPPQNDLNCSALCANGICAFLDTLSGQSLENANIDSASMIHILCGRISHEQKPYYVLTDLVLAENSEDTGFTDAITISQRNTPRLGYRLSVRETYTGLESWLDIEFEARVDENELKVRIGPWKLAEWLTTQRRLIPCKELQTRVHGDCPGTSQKTLKAFNKAAAEHKTFRVHDKSIYKLEFKDSAAGIAAIASTANLSPKYSIYVTDRECLSCCMRALMSVEDPNMTEFCILQLPM